MKINIILQVLNEYGNQRCLLKAFAVIFDGSARRAWEPARRSSTEMKSVG